MTDSQSEQSSGLQVALLESSFEKVKPQADQFADQFYGNLFTANPEAKPLFASTDMAKQKKMLIGSLVFVVENLRKPHALEDALKGLGSRHVKYGALPEHYPLVGNAILTTFSQLLGDDWTAETRQAWIDAYGAITEIMLSGADYDQDDVQLKSPETSAADPQPEQSGGLQVELLESSFEKVKPQADQFADQFYDNLFTANPEAKPLFASTDMAKQKKQLVASLVFVVKNLREPEALEKALKGLGSRHVKYGALPEHYPLVGNAILTTFGQLLGDDWTAATRQAWIDAYGAITEIMLSGADYNQSDIQLQAPTASGGSVASLSSEPAPKGDISWPLFGGVFAGFGILVGLILLL
jgi:hemoglobin-like flavoprotein